MSHPDFTILLVDDREENLISLEEILAQPGRSFIKAGSGNEALRQVLKNDKIGLIMLDVQMPDMDGYEVARLLKSNPRSRDISIIFVTAINKEAHYVLKGFEEGAVDYLQKPLDVDITCAKVNVFEKLYFSQQQLKETAAELSQINKQLEQFVYIVAHDLKSPLSGIITMLSVLEQDQTIVQQERARNYLSRLTSASLHLNGMITSILDYSRKSVREQAVELVNVHEMVTQIAYLLFPPQNIAITVEETLPTFRTRKLKLQQVFQNLISNAIKYNDKETGQIGISCRENGEFYEFAIRDNGPGIEEADQDLLFSLFQTGNHTARNESSTGVGLNILKMLVEEQGGKIWVESVKGDGSTFYFLWKK